METKYYVYADKKRGVKQSPEACLKKSLAKKGKPSNRWAKKRAEEERLRMQACH